jgi:hypothetical protein
MATPGICRPSLIFTMTVHDNKSYALIKIGGDIFDNENNLVESNAEFLSPYIAEEGIDGRLQIKQDKAVVSSSAQDQAVCSVNYIERPMLFTVPKSLNRKEIDQVFKDMGAETVMTIHAPYKRNSFSAFSIVPDPDKGNFPFSINFFDPLERVFDLYSFGDTPIDRDMAKEIAEKSTESRLVKALLERLDTFWSETNILESAALQMERCVFALGEIVKFGRTGDLPADTEALDFGMEALGIESYAELEKFAKAISSEHPAEELRNLLENDGTGSLSLDLELEKILDSRETFLNFLGNDEYEEEKLRVISTSTMLGKAEQSFLETYKEKDARGVVLEEIQDESQHSSTGKVLKMSQLLLSPETVNSQGFKRFYSETAVKKPYPFSAIVPVEGMTSPGKWAREVNDSGRLVAFPIGKGLLSLAPGQTKISHLSATKQDLFYREFYDDAPGNPFRIAEKILDIAKGMKDISVPFARIYYTTFVNFPGAISTKDKNPQRIEKTISAKISNVVFRYVSAVKGSKRLENLIREKSFGEIVSGMREFTSRDKVFPNLLKVGGGNMSLVEIINNPFAVTQFLRFKNLSGPIRKLLEESNAAVPNVQPYEFSLTDPSKNELPAAYRDVAITPEEGMGLLDFKYYPTVFALDSEQAKKRFIELAESAYTSVLEKKKIPFSGEEVGEEIRKKYLPLLERSKYAVLKTDSEIEERTIFQKEKLVLLSDDYEELAILDIPVFPFYEELKEKKLYNQLSRVSSAQFTPKSINTLFSSIMDMMRSDLEESAQMREKLKAVFGKTVEQLNETLVEGGKAPSYNFGKKNRIKLLKALEKSGIIEFFSKEIANPPRSAEKLLDDLNKRFSSLLYGEDFSKVLRRIILDGYGNYRFEIAEGEGPTKEKIVEMFRKNIPNWGAADYDAAANEVFEEMSTEAHKSLNTAKVALKALNVYAFVDYVNRLEEKHGEIDPNMKNRLVTVACREVFGLAVHQTREVKGAMALYLDGKIDTHNLFWEMRLGKTRVGITLMMLLSAITGKNSLMLVQGKNFEDILSQAYETYPFLVMNNAEILGEQRYFKMDRTTLPLALTDKVYPNIPAMLKRNNKVLQNPLKDSSLAASDHLSRTYGLEYLELLSIVRNMDEEEKTRVVEEKVRFHGKEAIFPEDGLGEDAKNVAIATALYIQRLINDGWISDPGKTPEAHAAITGEMRKFWKEYREDIQKLKGKTGKVIFTGKNYIGKLAARQDNHFELKPQKAGLPAVKSKYDIDVSVQAQKLDDGLDYGIALKDWMRNLSLDGVNGIINKMVVVPSVKLKRGRERSSYQKELFRKIEKAIVRTFEEVLPSMASPETVKWGARDAAKILLPLFVNDIKKEAGKTVSVPYLLFDGHNASGSGFAPSKNDYDEVLKRVAGIVFNREMAVAGEADLSIEDLENKLAEELPIERTVAEINDAIYRYHANIAFAGLQSPRERISSRFGRLVNGKVNRENKAELKLFFRKPVIDVIAPDSSALDSLYRFRPSAKHYDLDDLTKLTEKGLGTREARLIVGGEFSIEFERLYAGEEQFTRMRKDYATNIQDSVIWEVGESDRTKICGAFLDEGHKNTGKGTRIPTTYLTEAIRKNYPASLITLATGTPIGKLDGFVKLIEMLSGRIGQNTTRRMLEHCGNYRPNLALISYILSGRSGTERLDGILEESIDSVRSFLYSGVPVSEINFAKLGTEVYGKIAEDRALRRDMSIFEREQFVFLDNIEREVPILLEEVVRYFIRETKREISSKEKELTTQFSQKHGIPISKIDSEMRKTLKEAAAREVYGRLPGGLDAVKKAVLSGTTKLTTLSDGFSNPIQLSTITGFVPKSVFSIRRPDRNIKYDIVDSSKRIDPDIERSMSRENVDLMAVNDMIQHYRRAYSLGKIKRTYETVFSLAVDLLREHSKEVLNLETEDFNEIANRSKKTVKDGIFDYFLACIDGKSPNMDEEKQRLYSEAINLTGKIIEETRGILTTIKQDPEKHFAIEIKPGLKVKLQNSALGEVSYDFKLPEGKAKIVGKPSRNRGAEIYLDEEGIFVSLGGEDPIRLRYVVDLSVKMFNNLPAIGFSIRPLNRDDISIMEAMAFSRDSSELLKREIDRGMNTRVMTTRTAITKSGILELLNALDKREDKGKKHAVIVSVDNPEVSALVSLLLNDARYVDFLERNGIELVPLKGIGTLEKVADEYINAGFGVHVAGNYEVFAEGVPMDFINVGIYRGALGSIETSIQSFARQIGNRQKHSRFYLYNDGRLCSMIFGENVPHRSKRAEGLPSPIHSLIGKPINLDYTMADGKGTYLGERSIQPGGALMIRPIKIQESYTGKMNHHREVSFGSYELFMEGKPPIFTYSEINPDTVSDWISPKIPSRTILQNMDKEQKLPEEEAPETVSPAIGR